MDKFLEGVVRSPRHTSFYLSCGPAHGTPIVFLHGWPELSFSWRHQLSALGSLGFRAIAPDMRGYGRSSVPPEPSAYALEEIVADVLELLDHLKIRAAIFIGHDWGAPVVWSLAQHHSERCFAVACLCVPYIPQGFAPATLIPLSDRTVYPEDQHPASQWDYQLYYADDLDGASAAWEKDVGATVRTLFRAGSSEDLRRPAFTAGVRARGGFFGPGAGAPDLPRDEAVFSAVEESAYVAALTRNGFKGPDSWYVNAERNMAFSERARALAPRDARAVPTCRLRSDLRNGEIAPRRADAAVVQRPGRGRDHFRPLDGPGETDGGKRRTEPVARAQSHSDLSSHTKERGKK